MEKLARDSISLLGSTSNKPPLDSGPRLSSMGAVFIMLKSALGAGLLNFPWAFDRAGGIRSAVTVELISLVFLVSGLIILGYSSSISGRCTYQAVVKEVCGAAIGQLCELCFVFNLFMIAVAFLIIVKDQLEKLCGSLYEVVTGLPGSEMPYRWYTDRHFALVLVCMLLILPMSIPKEISLQKYIRLVLNNTDLLTDLNDWSDGSDQSSSWASIFSAIPTICFGFQCHEASIAIYSSMENQKLSHWVLISVLSMVFCLIIYSLTGIYGYLTFGKNVEADILMSYAGHDVLMVVARLLFGISIITVFPIIVLLSRSDPSRSIKAFERCSRYLLTILWITVTLLIAMFVPDISKVISVIGGISAFFIFIFPGTSPRSPLVLTTWGALTLVCGAFIFGQSTTIAVMQLLHKT
uniref:Solute carrier family 38 member 8a n=1 Tax=Neogobius melanostomus TaxID=47308 RepID=A0A8C6TDQ7_9GOBI